MERKTNRYFIFGSFLKKKEYNDIDILVVVPEIKNIKEITQSISDLSNKYPQNIIHLHIYTSDEYMNKDNKFSFKKVTNEITEDTFIELFKKSKTVTSAEQL